MKNLFSLLLIFATVALSAQTIQNIPYSTDFEEFTTEAEFLAVWSFENNLPTDQAGVWGFDYTAYFGYNSSNCPFYFTASNVDGDDWLFTPGFNLFAGTNYDLSFLYAGVSTGYTERMKIFIGTSDTSSAMTTELFDFTAITSDVFQNHSNTFSVPSSGVYYIGFYSYSVADNFGFLIDNFSLNLQTGLNSYSNDATTIYPNPSVGEVNVVSNEPFVWSFYSADGNCLIENKTSINPKIDLSSFSNGLYFLRINNEKAIPVLLSR